MVVLYILLALGVMFLIGFIWAKIEEKITDEDLEKYKKSSISNWKNKEIEENNMLKTNPELCKNLDTYKNKIEVVINMINNRIFPNDYTAMMCLVNITPKMYVKYYETVLSHVNSKDIVLGKTFIKNALINDFPMKIVDDILEMFIYVFNTHQNVIMLKEIINFDKSSKSLLALSCNQCDIDCCIDEAKRLVRVAENKN